VSPVKYERGFYIPEDTVLHSHRRENLKSYLRICIPNLRQLPVDDPIMNYYCYYYYETGFDPLIVIHMV
jgi:hypothetical protein